MKHPILKATAFAALATVLVFADTAAQEKAATPAPSALAGTYTLAKVDNGDLPLLIAEKDGCKQEVTAATLTVTPENKYIFESTIKETCGEKVQEKKTSEKGAVAATDAKISFTPDTPAGPVAEKPAAAEPTFANLYTGTVEGSDLKVTLKTEKVLVFKKK